MDFFNLLFYEFLRTFPVYMVQPILSGHEQYFDSQTGFLGQDTSWEVWHLDLLLPLALQPSVGFGLSKNVLPFFFLPATNYLHLLTPNTWRSLSTSSFHLFLGLPLLLVPSSSWVKFVLGILAPSILSRWPNQVILYTFIHFTIFSPLLISSSSQFIRLFHSPFPYLGPYVLLNIFLPKINRAWSSFFVNVHVSAPYDTAGLISVLYNIILVALDKSQLLKRLITAK